MSLSSSWIVPFSLGDSLPVFSSSDDRQTDMLALCFVSITSNRDSLEVYGEILMLALCFVRFPVIELFLYFRIF